MFFVTSSIVAEYVRIYHLFIEKYNVNVDPNYFNYFLGRMYLVEPTKHYDICRDKTDNIFLDCAYAANAVCIVSGDNDLLCLKEVDSIKIINAHDFCKTYLEN